VHRVGGQLAGPADAERFAELAVGMRLEPVIVGLALEIFIDRQVVFDRAGRRLLDEV
jgi:hypothetical protein